MNANPLKRAIERTCTDAAYRARFLADPRAVLAEAGIETPPEVEIRVHESTEGELLIVVPAPGQSALGETRRSLPVGKVNDVPQGISLEWQETPNLPRRTLVIKGRVDDQTAPALRRELERTFVDVDLDLAGVAFLGSAGLGSLVAAQQSLRARDCTMCLRLVPAEIRNVIEVSGLIDFFDVYDAESYKKLFPKGAGFLFGGVAPGSPLPP